MCLFEKRVSPFRRQAAARVVCALLVSAARADASDAAAQAAALAPLAATFNDRPRFAIPLVFESG